MVLEIVCPECLRKRPEIKGVERINKSKWYQCVCEYCGEDWQEETINRYELVDPEIDTMLLGVEISEAAKECLTLIGSYNQGRYCGTAMDCFEILDQLEALVSRTEASWGKDKMKELCGEYKKNITWALKELETFVKETEKISQRASEIAKQISFFTS